MRILTVINMYPPHHLGGYEIACRGVMERFAERGHQVVVLTGDVRLEGVAETPLPLNIEVRRELAAWWDWDNFGPLAASMRRRVRIEKQTQRAVRRALAEFRPDVVSVWSLRFLSYSIATLVEHGDVPVVLTLCDDWICYSHTFDGWTRLFDRRPWARPMGAALRLATRLPTFERATVSVASEMIAGTVAQNSPWQFPRAEVIRLGVETRDFPLSAPQDRPWSWKLLYVGRVLPIKGVPTLIKAMAHLPAHATLEVDGHAHDDERRAMAALSKEIGVGDRVRFVRSPRAALRARYRQADAVVFPSEWAEPFGIVPLEAMACGVPVVASGTGGSGEFLADGVNCVMFPPGDARALADALHAMAADPELRTRVAQGGEATARHMTMDGYAERLEVLHLAAAGVTPR